SMFPSQYLPATVNETPLSTLPFLSFPCQSTATTEIYTLSLHDALPILCQADAVVKPLSRAQIVDGEHIAPVNAASFPQSDVTWRDRKSTRLNSSHVKISYAVFCLKKKTNNTQ